jgi:hypothetical protein
MRSIVAAALLAGIALTPTQASAQRYYARERIVGVALVTYAPTYGAYGTCDVHTATQTASIASCTGSDGRAADASKCTPATISRSCTPVYTYVPTYGAWSVCTSLKQTATITACTRSDGKSVATSMCTPKTVTQACTPTYTCDPVEAGRYIVGGSNTGGGYLGQTVARTTGWEQRAAAICQAAMANSPNRTACVVDTYEGHESTLSVSLYTASLTPSGSSNPTYYGASVCRAK